MANIDNVQLPDGSSYNIVDNTSGFATQNYVDSAVSSVTKTTIGLGNVDNTSDLSKPISTATQAALDTLDEDKADKTDIAPVESSSTASQSYAIGDQFYYNGLLYKATAVINSGGTITPNGNCEFADSVVEQLKNTSHIVVEELTRTTGSLSEILLPLKTGYSLINIMEQGGNGWISRINNSNSDPSAATAIITNYLGQAVGSGKSITVRCYYLKL